MEKEENAGNSEMQKDKDLKEQDYLDIKPIEKLVLIDHIIEAIGHLIASGKLKPGDVVPSERMLSNKLKVSRNSIRQALKALDVLGVLDINPGSRTYLNTSISNLLINPMKFMTLCHGVTTSELFQTRKIIEVELAKLASINAQEEDIEEMFKALEKVKENIKNKEKCLKYEMIFHEKIFKSSGNRVLTALMASINNLLLKSREKTIKLFPDLNLTLNQHYEIYEAIKEKNPEKAAKTMLDHLNTVEQIMDKNNNKK